MLRRHIVGAQVWIAELRHRWLDERGATAVEYALMLALIAVVIAIAVTTLGANTAGLFGSVDF
jgi:pilus assembly protein Flp/PilA